MNRNFSNANQFRRPQEIMNRGYNRFEVLNNESECPKFNNFGHTAGECSSRFTSVPINNVQIPEYQKTWKRKDDLQGEVCGIALQAQDKRNDWYVDSGCSKHMTGDKNRFVDLKKERMDQSPLATIILQRF